MHYLNIFLPEKDSAENQRKQIMTTFNIFECVQAGCTENNKYSPQNLSVSTLYPAKLLV